MARSDSPHRPWYALLRLGAFAAVLAVSACTRSLPGSVALPQGAVARVAPLAATERELVLELVASLPQAEPLAASGLGVAAVGREVLVQFADGRLHDLPGAERVAPTMVAGLGRYRLSAALDAGALQRWQTSVPLAYAEPVHRLSITGKRVQAAAQRVGPNDPGLNTAWGYARVGGGELWARGVRPKNPVIVAVVDTGVDADHEDLRGVVVQGRNLVQRGQAPYDKHGHGTHCAGVIAALADNGKGVAGVAAGVRIMPIKALGDDGSGEDPVLVDAIESAVAGGAKVISMSLGTDQDLISVRRAIQAAVAKGVVIVASSGNQGAERALYPARYPEVIAVGATDLDDMRAMFSNDDRNVRLTAPGVVIRSTVPGGYDYMSGTSMAAPHVSAAFAFLVSFRPDMTPAAMFDLLVRSGAKVSGFSHRAVGLDLLRAASEAGLPVGALPTPDPNAPTPGPDPDPGPSLPPGDDPATPPPGSGGSVPMPDWGDVALPGFGGGGAAPAPGPSAAPLPGGGGAPGFDWVPLPSFGGNPTSGASNRQTTVPDPEAMSDLDRGRAALLDVLATRADLEAFDAEAARLARTGALAPGSAQRAVIKDLQKALRLQGAAVRETGSFDDATAAAVIAWKRTRGMHEPFRDSRGVWAVRPSVDLDLFGRIVLASVGK
jgi:subtilisin family serine protease